MLNMLPKEDEEANLMYLHTHMQGISSHESSHQTTFQTMAMHPVEYPGWDWALQPKTLPQRGKDKAHLMMLP